MQKFSVLMSVYIKEKPEHLDECLDSLKNQTIQPSEVVLVQDGPLSCELIDIINNWKNQLNIVDVILEENKGLGQALNIGLKHCSYEIVARMDSDDICVPDRFEYQLEIIKKDDIDLVGSWVSEFHTDPNIHTSLRQVPSTHKDIIKFAQLRNPLNHPTVMYKKSVIQKHGSYEDVLYFEDYFLWLKLLSNNIKMHNIQRPLVQMRAGPNLLARRRGLDYIRKELNFLNLSLERNYIKISSYLIGLLIKLPIRLLPRSPISLVYKLLRKTN